MRNETYLKYNYYFLDLCDDHECDNEGTCFVSEDNPDTPKCKCRPGFEGETCETGNVLLHPEG